MKIKNLVVLTDVCQKEVLFFNKFLHLNIEIYNPSFIRQKPLNEQKISELRDKYGDFVLMVARLSPQKNHKSLIKAMAYIREKYHYSCNLLMVGEGELEEELKIFAVENGMADVCFSRVTSQNLRIIMQQHICSLFQFSEGLPTY